MRNGRKSCNVFVYGVESNLLLIIDMEYANSREQWCFATVYKWYKRLDLQAINSS